MTSEYAQALAEAQAWVGDVPGVEMVAEGADQRGDVIEIWVTEAVDRDTLPSEVRGVRVVVHDTEGFDAFDAGTERL